MLFRKDVLEDILSATLLAVVVFLMLGLLALVVLRPTREQLFVVDLPQPEKIPKPTIGVDIVASVYGAKYYPPGCAGAGRIKKENLIAFMDEGSAEKAGYTMAKACR